MKLITKFQDGGQMGAPAAEPAAALAPEMGAPAQGGEDQIAQLAGQLLEALLNQLQNPEAVMAVLQAAMDMLNQAAGQGQPVFRAGGKLKCGGKMKKANAKK